MNQSPAWPARVDSGLTLLAGAVLAAYLLGAFAVDAARAACLACLLWVALRVRGLVAPAADPGPLLTAAQTRLGFAALGTLWALVTAHLLLRYPLGEHGIDFAIFSQAVDGIARTGAPWVTLVAGAPRNFLTHHLAPILYLPGALAATGLAAPVALVVVQALGLLGAFGALYRAFRSLGVEASAALLWLLAAALSPAVRAAFAWTPNDELLGVPFLAAAYAAWLAGRFGWAAAALLGSCLCKESFSLVAVAFSAMALLGHGAFHPVQLLPRARRAFVPVALVGGVLFVGYFFLQPWLLSKGFDHADKLLRAEQLADPGRWGHKALYLLAALAPTGGLALFSRRGRLLLVPALPGLAFTAVSAIDEMWRPLTYYAVVPVLASFVGGAANLPALLRRLDGAAARALLLAAVLGALSFQPLPLARTVWRASRGELRSRAQLAQVPQEARVAADPAAALFLLDRPGLRRLWTVTTQGSDRPVDVVVWRPGGYEAPTPELLEGMADCGSTELWNLRCRRASASASAATPSSAPASAPAP
jgi:hypothetical protein